MEYKHIPVLYNEVIKTLNIKSDGIYFDATLGGGGHSEGILKSIDQGYLYATDKDQDALRAADERLSAYRGKYRLIHSDFRDFISLTDAKFDGIIADLGISSHQIDSPERGFSYIADGRLDMRMDDSGGISAYEVVNTYPQGELARILREYGEEKFASSIARTIAERRKSKPIESTLELAALVEKCYPAKLRYKSGNPAKQTFQAIRIEVNRELTGLDKFIYDCVSHLKTGGRLCVITFHSLEDRIVKNAFKYLEADCICDKRAPVCVCGKVKEVVSLYKKPLTASKKEIAENKRAQSAKLRAVEKIEDKSEKSDKGGTL
ncbi:MAG: 16S rRNA (cytosine(1402)-N(4))-methyltransferase RsmH [Christensenellales bacterium]|jgi:16S rRNA (cytosine1402-N4)-methyltransferase